eukprot:TRINITY_DN16170_c0_g1_i3.p1 TRINITY_DN16170_c0_g1~~TRINITY_DN16170_c0_g1_i3.p1  ORF type:complete len:259 (-),score=44.99 TRINITY_DN16170_c0_g1_i3:115-891(-)
MGSKKTYIIHTLENLQELLNDGVSAYLDGPIDYEVEKFVHGKMYHVDGFVESGVVKILWPSVYINSCSSFKRSKFLGSYQLSKDNPLTFRLMECVVEILNSMDQPRSYSFHVEVFHTPEDEFYLCEAACRTGGAGVSQATLWLLGVDLNKASIQSQCEAPLTSPLPGNWRVQKLPDKCYGWIVVYPKPGTIEYIPSAVPPEYSHILDFQCTPKRVFTDIEHCTDALGSFLLCGKDEEEVRELIEKAVDWLWSETKWFP